MERTFKDIPYKSAYRAYTGTSFSPEKRAQSYIDGYSQSIKQQYEQFKKRVETNLDQFEDWFTTYEEKIYRLELANLSKMSNVMSTMITGRSNFPVRSQEKKRRWLENHGSLMDLFHKKADKSFKRIFTTSNIIKSGDDDAVEKLKAKIEGLEKLQNLMKEANKIVKSKKIVDKVPALMALGLKEKHATELLQPDFCGRLGFASYALTNNNANLNTCKKRLVQLERNKSLEDQEVTKNGITLKDCPSDNRIRLFFDGKPSDDIRTQLKKNGFRWTPSLTCWQSYRNRHSMDTAKQVLGL